ncbi:ATP-binding protein [Lentzea sp. NPDC054927]
MRVVVFGLTVAAEVAAVALAWGREPLYDTLMYAVSTVVMAGAGALIVRRSPVGWLFLGFALLSALCSDLAQGLGLHGWVIGLWLSYTGWLPSGFGWILTFLLFPDGRLPGRGWRAVLWVASSGLVLAVVGWSFGPSIGQSLPGGHNPFAVPGLPAQALLTVGMSLYLGSMLASVVALVVRFRRSHGVLRQQLKWFVFAAALAGVMLPLSFFLWYVTPLAGVIAAVPLMALPVAASVAILRYRLYDIDFLISRTVSYATLTVLLAAAYAVTAVVLGTALGRGSAWVTAAATLVVALAFRPLRARVQDVVDRQFNRARYDAVHRVEAFLEELRAGRAAPEDVRDVLREVLDDPGLELHLSGQPSSVEGRGQVVVERDGQRLGVVTYTVEASPVVLRQVVEAAGLAVEIVRLRAELRRQLAEVEASRARIVAVADAERRRIERDLHDGAQQRMVAIGLALRHAQHQLTNDGPADGGRLVDAAGRLPAADIEGALTTLDAAVDQVGAAIAELRALAHGLPPAQLDAGLAPAFRDLAGRAPVPVSVDVPPGRFGTGAEAAAYFVGCEGLTNAVKHAGATRVALTAARRDGTLVVTVTDDGVGGATPGTGTGLTGLADRLEALGGTLRIDSVPGAGTTLTAEVPCAS